MILFFGFAIQCIKVAIYVAIHLQVACHIAYGMYIVFAQGYVSFFRYVFIKGKFKCKVDVMFTVDQVPSMVYANASVEYCHLALHVLDTVGE